MRVTPKGPVLLSRLAPLLREGRTVPIGPPLLLLAEEAWSQARGGEGEDREGALLGATWSRRDALIFRPPTGSLELGAVGLAVWW